MEGDVAPDLRRAFITDVERRGDRLVLRINGARRAGVLLSGTVAFESAAVSGFDPRGAEPDLAAGARITGQESRPGRTTLDVLRTPGPGEEDALRFVLTHGAVSAALSPAPLATVLDWFGVYPRRKDVRG